MSAIKKFLNAVIRLSSQANPKLTPSAVQLVRITRKIGAQKTSENIVDIPTHMEWMFLGETVLPEQIIYEFKNVVVSWNGIVIQGLQLFVPSLAYFTYEEEYSGIFLLRQLLSKKVKVNRTVGLIYDNWSVANYYHWLADTLPRLLVLREKYPNCTLLVPTPVPDYISLTIAALGFRDTLALTKDSFIQVQHLVMPSHIAHPGRHDPDLIQKVRKEVLESFGYSAEKVSSMPSKRIYASRSRQKIRRLVNEDEILPLLLHCGFEIVYFEEMSFEEQVKTTQCASVFMGVHGANLTNMLFMSSGTQVIELLNEQVPNPCYFQLASNLELSYQALPCHPSSSSELANNNHISANPALLSKILEALQIMI